MKRLLLSLAAAVLAVFGAMAEEVTFDFSGTTEKYGIPYEETFYATSFVTAPYVISEGNVSLTLEPTSEGGWARCGKNSNTGLYVGDAAGESAVISISIPNSTITKVETVITPSTAMSQWTEPPFSIDGVELTYDGAANVFAWSGEKSNTVKFNFIRMTGAKCLKTLKITYEAGAAVEPTFLTLSGVNPADGTSFANWQAPTECTFDFTNDNPGSFPGIAVNRDCAEKIQVQRMNMSGKYVTAYEIDPANTEKVYVDARYDGRLHVVFNEALPLVGTNVQEQYQIVLPQGLVRKYGLSANPEADVTAEEINKEEIVGYTIKKLPSYSSTPGNGETVSTVIGNLNTVTVDFEAGTVLKVADNAKATLYKVTSAGLETKVGEYSIAASGATATLTYDGTAAIPVLTDASTYKIVVGEGDLMTDDGWGMYDPYPEVVINGLRLIWLDNSNIVLEGLEPQGGTYASAQDFPKEFTMVFPGAVNTTGLTSGCSIKRGTTTVATITGEASADKKSIKWTIKPATGNAAELGNSSSTINGNPQWWIAGDYTIEIAANKIIDIENSSVKNAKMTFGPWKCETGADNLVAYDYINNSQNFFKDGVQIITSKKIEPQAFGAIPNDPGFGQIYLKFLTTCKMNEDAPTSAMTLKKSGSSEVLMSVNPSSKLNVVEKEGDEITGMGHIWNTVGPIATTAVNQANKNNTAWYIFYDLTSDMSYGNAAGTGTMRYTPGYLTEPGTYTFHVDKGFFVTDDGVLSEEINIEFTILGLDLETTIAPANNANVGSLKDITITYPEGTTTSVAEGVTVQLDYSTPISDSLKELMPVFKVSCEGNVVTLSADKAFAIPDKYNYVLNIPGNVWNVTYGGMTEGNRSVDLKYFITDVEAGTVTPAPTAEGETIAAADLSTIVYNSVVAISTAEDTKLGNAVLYSVADGTRTQVATYSGVAAGNVITWTTTADLSALAGGEYEFVIPANAVAYAGLKSSVNATKDFVYAYKLQDTASFADIFTLVQPAKTEVYDYELGEDGLTMAFSFKDTKIEQTTDSNLKLTLSFDDEVIAEIPATSSAIEFEEAMEWGGNVIDGSFFINFPDVVKDFDLRTAGTYTLVIPNGFYTSGGVNVIGATYSVKVVKKPVDFTYTLAPAAGSEVETLAEVVLQFPNAGDINYASDSKNPVATLASEDGTVVVTSIYPALSSGNSLTLKFGDANTNWVNGKYTLTVHAGTVNLDNPNFDDSVIGSGNFEGLTAEYTLNAKAAQGDIKEYISLSLPSSLEANQFNTVMPGMGSCGLGVIGLGLKTTAFAGVAGADFISLYYQKDENSSRELLNVINPANENEVFVLGASIMDESDLPSFTPTSVLYMMFANNGEGDIDETVLPDYTREGYYTLVIPDGAFSADGIILKGTELTYHYKNETGGFNYEYTLEPDAALTKDEPINKAAEVFGVSGTGIVLTFVGTNQVDCDSNPATLTCPDGTVLTKNTPSSNWTNKLTWKFGTQSTKWADGEYVFEIFPGKIYVNMGFVEDLPDGTEGNFPGLKAVYYVSDLTGVTLIGVDKADSYTVYTMDGKLVRLNATMDQMLDIEPGLYIVNGKKAYIRK